MCSRLSVESRTVATLAGVDPDAVRDAIRRRGPPANLRDRQAAILWCGDEGHRQRRKTGNWPLAQQSGREFTSAISTKRTCNEQLQAHANLAEIRCCPRFHSQPFQSRPKPLPTRSLQGQPHRRTRRVARPLCGIKGQGRWPCTDELAFV